jgi:hypothetical protein
MVVHCDASPVELNSRGFEVEPLDVWRASNGHKDFVANDRFLMALSRNDNRLSVRPWLDAQDLHVEEHADRLALEGRRQDIRRVSVFARQEAPVADDGDFTPETPKCLRQLASDRPCSDDEKSLRQLRQRENRFVREKAGLGEPRYR